MKKIYVLLVVLGLLLSACGGENLPDDGLPSPPSEPVPGQGEWSRGEAFVNDAQLILMESFPIQVAVEIQQSERGFLAGFSLMYDRSCGKPAFSIE